MSWIRWFQTTVRERLAPYQPAPRSPGGGSCHGSDQRSDIQVARLESSLTASETVLRMMDGRYDGAMGLFVLTSERILFAPATAPGRHSACRCGKSLPSRPPTRRVSGTVRVTTPDGSLTVDRILGTQGEMLADDAREAIRGKPRPERDPLEVWPSSAHCVTVA